MFWSQFWHKTYTQMQLALIVVALAAPLRAAQNADFPITLTSQYARTEKTASLTGGKSVFTSMDNNVTFNSNIPGTTHKGQQISMNYNRIESRSQGQKNVADNIGFFISMSDNNYSITNNFSLVETQAAGAAEPVKNKGVNMSVALNWPRLPRMNLLLTSFESGAQSTQSGQFTTSYRIGRTSLSYNSVETSVDSPTAPSSESTNRSLSASRLHVSTPHLSISSNMNFNRQSAVSGGNINTRSESDNYSLAIYDSHIKAVPLNLNLSLQKNKQLTGAVSPTQSARSINAFTSFALPLGVRTDVTFNQSLQTESTSGQKTNSRVLGFTVNKRFPDRGVLTLSHTAQRSTSVSSPTASENLNTVVTYSTPVLMAAMVTIQQGRNQVSGPSLNDATSFLSLNIQSKMRGGIISTYQYRTTRAGTNTKSESFNISVPVSRSTRVVLDATRKQTPIGRENILGIITSIGLTPSTSLSTTYSRQKLNGTTTNRVWGMWATSSFPGRMTLSFGVSSQTNQDFESLSTTMTLQSTF